MDEQQSEADTRTLAQFFFEVGYGACYADAYIKNGEKVPFELTDAIIDRSWEIAAESYEDGAEFDAKQALSDAAPEMLGALNSASAWLERWAAHVGSCAGGAKCTCGLTAIRHECEVAIANATGIPS